jgi:primosomal protein N' (replication factor Y) (superfamily II helicase)
MSARHYARIAVNRPVQQSFHYQIPDELQGTIMRGHLVEVEFGTTTLNGVVVGFDADTPAPYAKPILRILDPEPALTALQIDIAYWLAEQTIAPLGSCLWLMLPPGLTSQSAQRYTLVDTSYMPTTPKQSRLFSLLQRRGPLSSHQLDRLLGDHMQWRAVMRPLLNKDIVQEEKILRPASVRPKTLLAARLAILPQAIESITSHLGRDSRRANVLEVLLMSPAHTRSKKQIMDAVGCTESPIKTLARDGVVSIEDRTVRLLLDVQTTHTQIREYRGVEPYLAVLKFLAHQQNPTPIVDILNATGASRKQVQRLADDGFIIVSDDEIWRDPVADIDVAPDLPPPLTNAQQAVWDAIRPQLDRTHWGDAVPDAHGEHVFLLHGVTGSGKTEIYLRAVERILAQGRQAIILVPEIALTAQLVRRFMARFPGQTSVVHSGLSIGERYDTWRRARTGELSVVVGARSALFTPFPDIGLVVLDEEHDDSYKQDGAMSPLAPPYYHARDVAIEMMRRNRGTVILGSATPDVTTMFRAQQGEFELLTMPDRVIAHRAKIARQITQLNLPDSRYVATDASEAVSIDLPPVRVIDMRHELSMGNRSIFSRELHTALHEVLRKREQAILFLNRRGTSTFVMCRDCGYIAKCPNCDTPLTYHAHDSKLRCHHCGNEEPLFSTCPECESTRIRHFGTGTELVDRTLSEQFPEARVLRWDQDTARKRNAHREILQRFLDREADFLVGTQMIAKGLDIPLVTLVGIISGDTALGLPDYRVGERTFQLLTQVAGRAGRGVLGGRVILQTYQPEHYAVAAAAEHDYTTFYAHEIDYRRQLNNPPYTHLVRLLFRHRIQNKVLQQAEQVAAQLHKRLADSIQFPRTEIIGPTPCFYMRLDNVFRWQILVRTQDPVGFFNTEKLPLPNDVTLDIDPTNLL